jgi:hypothetical protein
MSDEPIEFIKIKYSANSSNSSGLNNLSKESIKRILK